MSEAMDGALVAAVEKIDDAALDWDDLAERTCANPFVRRGWVLPWWRAFGKGRLQLRTVRRAADARLAALLPMRAQQGVLGSPTNWHTPSFGILAESDAARDALLKAMFEERRRRVSVAFVGEDEAARLRGHAAEHGYKVIARTLQRSPYVEVSGTWESYLGTLDGGLRRDVRRRRRLLGTRGAVSFEVTTGERLDERLAEGMAVEASGWKGERKTAIGSMAETLGFYAELARWAAARGWLRLCFLRLDGRAIAFDYALEHDRVHYLLKTGYDREQRELSPGKLLRYEMIARAFELRLRSYEFLGTDDPWKLEWTQTTRSRELVQSFRPGALGALDWSVFEFGRPFAKRVRDLARQARAARKAAT
jgi:CelD/BcsL family acetyltransferase involved in cellulose biosynthesis